MPRRAGDSWLGLMHELQTLRRPLVFAPLRLWRSPYEERDGPTVELFEGGARATKRRGSFMFWHAAATASAMRAGRHFAVFTLELLSPEDLDQVRVLSLDPRPTTLLGVIRAEFDVASRGVCVHDDDDGQD